MSRSWDSEKRQLSPLYQLGYQLWSGLEEEICQGRPTGCVIFYGKAIYTINSYCRVHTKRKNRLNEFHGLGRCLKQKENKQLW